MIKANFEAWCVHFDSVSNQKTIEDQLRFLIGFAVLAPSAHNSQPWKFNIKSNTIEILPDLSRQLSVSDPASRQLYIALGCALKNLLVAADYYGFQTLVDFLSSERGLSLKVTFEKTAQIKQESHHLIFSIPRRLTNRNNFEPRLPYQSFLDSIKAHEVEGVRIDVLNAIQDSQQKGAVMDIYLEALLAAMDDASFRCELAGYLRSNLTHEPTGMMGASIGMPTLPSLLAPYIVRRINVHRLMKKKNEFQLHDFTPVFGIISSERNDPRTWVHVGELFQTIALEATREGLAINPMAAATEVGDFYIPLQRLLGISLRPQFSFRLGYAKKFPPHTPRFSMKDVTDV